MSYDIECAGRKGVFPEAEKDRVIQIAACVSEYGQNEPFSKVVFTLKSCAPISGAQVISFEDEVALLQVYISSLLSYLHLYLY